MRTINNVPSCCILSLSLLLVVVVKGASLGGGKEQIHSGRKSITRSSDTAGASTNALHRKLYENTQLDNPDLNKNRIRFLADYNDSDTDADERCSEFLISFLEGTTDAHDTCEGIMNAYTAAGAYFGL
jgi:hypothetical protein